ncbi:hypothetical protein PR202_gb05925 [Eleusine coracana subsp. coracana]|uniref:Peptidase A1 domain-containing protein n=1 Tax=Eleusine coracana subsp. coracana TaxID=191504 RepID=A0AAV5E893_ELECO|nr:hypothetical protein PR202_gb05925 [Eleusine coracana subsp. coracana]
MAFIDIKFRPGDKIRFGTVSLVANQYGNLVEQDHVARSAATMTSNSSTSKASMAERIILVGRFSLGLDNAATVFQAETLSGSYSTSPAMPRSATLADSDLIAVDLPTPHVDQSDEDPNFFDESRFVATIGLENESVLDLIEGPSNSESCSSDYHEVDMDLCAMRLTGVALVLSALLTSAARPSFPVELSLERASFLKGAHIKELTKWDVRRHTMRGLLLDGAQDDVTGVVHLPVLASISPYLTILSLGNPPKNFTVLIDVHSAPAARYQAAYANLSNRCSASMENGLASCDSPYNQNPKCDYNLVYGSGSSATRGYYVSDEIHFDTIGGNMTGFSASVIFGCSNVQSGALTETNLAFDGILGLGPNQQSVNAQLNDLGLAPMVFTMCLMSSGNGNGKLFLGEAVAPGLVYTPLVPTMPYYMLYLENIAVNGQKLPINSSAFETSNDGGTIVDSGTTLAYIADQAYDPFVNAIAAAVSPSVRAVINNGEYCFITSSTSIHSSFPLVTLHFVGPAVMTVKPENYLLPEILLSLQGDESMFCLGWKRQRGFQQLTILGDIVLMDKIIVHDLDNMRLGWMDYDCNTFCPYQFYLQRSARPAHCLSVTVDNKSETISFNPDHYGRSSSTLHSRRRALIVIFLLIVIGNVFETTRSDLNHHVGHHRWCDRDCELGSWSSQSIAATDAFETLSFDPDDLQFVFVD